MDPYYLTTPGIYEPNGWPIAIFAIATGMILFIFMILAGRAHEKDMIRREKEYQDELDKYLDSVKQHYQLEYVIKLQQVMDKKNGIRGRLL